MVLLPPTHLSAQNRLPLVHQVGMMIAQAVFHGDNIPLHLTHPLLKQVSNKHNIMLYFVCIVLQLLGIPLSHPEDLELVDEVLFHNLTSTDDISGNGFSYQHTIFL